MDVPPNPNGQNSLKRKRRKKTDLFRRKRKKTDLNYDVELPRSARAEQAAPKVYKNSYRHRNTGHVPNNIQEFEKQRALSEVNRVRISDETLRKRKKTRRANNALRREIEEKRKRGEPIDIVEDHVGPEPSFLSMATGWVLFKWINATWMSTGV